MSINRVNITGNLTRDPELRATAGGNPGSVLWRRRERSSPQPADWRVGGLSQLRRLHYVRHGAEAVSRFLAKGNKVAIEGKLRYSSWERDGQKRSKLEVIVDEIEVMVRREGQAQAQPQQSLADTVPVQPQAQAAPQWSAQQAYAAVPQSEFYDEDVPF